MRRALTIPFSPAGVAILSKFSQTVELCAVFAEGGNPGLLEITNGAGQRKNAFTSGNQPFTDGLNFFPNAQSPPNSANGSDIGGIVGGTVRKGEYR